MKYAWIKGKPLPPFKLSDMPNPWYRCLDPILAREQHAWEYRHMVKRAYDCDKKLTYEAIAERAKCSSGAIGVMLRQARRECERKSLSPLERYLIEPRYMDPMRAWSLRRQLWDELR